MKTKLLFLLIFLFIFTIILASNNVPYIHSVLFAISFSILFIFTTYYTLNHKAYSPFIASYVVFYFLFFLVAPLLQINSFFESGSKRFFNGLVYSDSLIIKANVIIILFNITFFLTYFLLIKRKTYPRLISINSQIPLYLLLFFLINLIVFFWKYDYLMEKFALDTYSKTSVTKMSGIINSKFLHYLPFAPIVLGINYLKLHWKNRKNNFYIVIVIISVLILMLLMYKNPLTTKRNDLGPIYITLIFFIFPKLVNTNFKILTLLFFSLIVLFPMSSLITHSNKKLSEMSFNEMMSSDHIKEGITSQFTNLNFDAFLMAATTVDYTDKEGYLLGKQLMPTLFFFIPRDIWKSKPVTSGELMGEHIQKHHDKRKWFHNLAEPLIAEAYIDFGIFGIVLYAVILALTCLLFVNWLQSNDPLRHLAAFYFSIHLIFLLRGDLTNGYVYYILPFFAFFVFPKVFMKLIKLK